ncbi:hypothetical protein [Beduini massiliensis]|uniref:hypothetical protein n=1 Tax=Beduini massiliensis TaxID=1585974 RepID=UPI000694180B|nr:hypothetical protein [Beduini massiliensis]
MLKKILIVCLSLMLIVLTGCSGKPSSTENLNDLSLEQIMEKVYAGIKEDQLPGLMNTPLSQENLNYALGLDALDFKEGLVSEPMMSSIAHSVVIVRVNDGVDVEKTKADIEANIDPRKWICVEVNEKDVIVDSKDNVIILIMVNDLAKDIHNNFKKL